MKKILFWAALIAMTSTMTGCSLDETPKSKFDESVAYSSTTLVYVNTVASLYNKLHSRFKGGDDNYNYMSEFTSDVLFLPGRQGDWVDGGKHQNAFLHKWDPSTDYIKGLWNDSYSDIALCNSSIAKLLEIRDELKTLTPEVINPYLAEVRGIRAFYYMWLVDFFGRIPYVTSPETGIGDVKQLDRAAAYDSVKNELCAILPYLTDNKSQEQGEYYSRITKPVVYAMIARLAINGAVFTQNEWTNGQFTGGIAAVESGVTAAGKADMWTVDGKTMNAWETVVYCQEKLGELGYKLESNFASNFKTGNEGSKENIFVQPMDDDVYRNSDTQVTRSLHYNHASTIGFSSWNGTAATTHVLNVFGYVEDYEKEPGTTQAKPGALEKGTFECADPRFATSFFYGSCSVGGTEVGSGVSADKWPKGFYIGYAAKNDYSTEDYSDPWGLYIVKWGGVRIRKYEYDPTTSGQNYFNADRVIFRYGDMLLLAAEAQYRLGETTKATDLLNEVRERAFTSDTAAVAVKDMSLQKILDEKIREEIWETMGRRGDLVRYGLYTEANEDKYLGVKRAPVSADWEYDADGYTCVFPIPVDVLNLNKNLSQNPGY